MFESCVLTWRDNCLVVELSGEIDHHVATALRRVLDREIEEKSKEPLVIHLIFDFRKVVFMDSAGIGVIMGRYNKIKMTGGTVYVTDPQPYVDRILEMAGIYLITRRKDSLKEALTELEGKAGAVL